MSKVILVRVFGPTVLLFSGLNFTDEMLFSDLYSCQNIPLNACRRNRSIGFLHEKSFIVHFWPGLQDGVPELKNLD